MEGERLGVIALFAATILWAISNLAYDSFIKAGHAVIVILWVISIFRFSTVWFITDFKKIPHEWAKDSKELFFAILNGFFSIGTMFFALSALEHTNLANVMFLAYTAPAWVLVGSVLFLGEKPSIKKGIALIATIMGVMLISNPQDIFSVNLGVLFALAAGITYAGDIITSRELKDYSFHTVSTYSNGVQFVVFSIAILFFVNPPLEVFLAAPLLVFAVVGVMRGTASDLYYYSLERLEASTASVISLFELILTVLLAAIVLGQFPKELELMGYLLIIGSAAIILLRKSDIENFEQLIFMRRKH
ncbi:MAG: DMT family transporter [archaeon]|nr:DMT family transporter [archaeon]